MPIDRPTFSESWYRVANLRPRLRPTIRSYRQQYRGQMYHVLEDPAAGQFFRLSEPAYRMIGLLDGRRTVAEVWNLCNQLLGDDAPTQNEVIQALGSLYGANLLEADLPPDSAAMFERYRHRVRREVRSYVGNILFLRVPLLDPDRFLEAWVGVLGWLFSWVGMILWAGLLLYAGSRLTDRWGELWSHSNGVLAPDNLPILGVIFALVKACHELGHGFACKRFGLRNRSGGEVHTIGVMFMVLMPIPYVDASASWAFRSKWQRAAVACAGMYVELALAAVAAIVWSFTAQGSFVNAAAYNVIFVAGVATLLFNANPLIRFDGYYILCDVLELPNLAERSKAYLTYLAKRYALGVRRPMNPARSLTERPWLAVYGVASFVYRLTIMLSITLFIATQLFFIGVTLAIIGLVSFFVFPIFKAAHYLLNNPELGRVRVRAVTVSLAAVAAVILAVGVWPAPDRGRAEGVVEPRRVVTVAAGSSGFLTAAAPSGQIVRPDGPPLVSADNPELLARLRQLQATRAEVEARHRVALAREPAYVDVLTRQLAAVDVQIREAQEELDRLQVHAPFLGMWISPRVEDRLGAYLRQGEPVGMLADLDQLMIRAVVDQNLGPRIEPEVGAGGRVEARVRGRPDLSFTGTIHRVLPAGQRELPSAALGYLGGGSLAVTMTDQRGTHAASPFFEVWIDPDPADRQRLALMTGQRVVIRFDLPHRPYLQQWYRAARQLLQRRFQI